MMWRHISRIQRHGQVYAFDEMLHRNRRYSDKRSGVGHSGGIFRGTEDGDAVIRGTESFDAFERLLAVVQGGGHAMEAKIRVCDESWRGPLAGVDGVVGFDVAIDFADSEADVLPVCYNC